MRYGATYLEDDYDSGWSKVPESVWRDCGRTAGISRDHPLPGIYYPAFSFSGNGSSQHGKSGGGCVRGRSHNSNLKRDARPR